MAIFKLFAVEALLSYQNLHMPHFSTMCNHESQTWNLFYVFNFCYTFSIYEVIQCGKKSQTSLIWIWEQRKISDKCFWSFEILRITLHAELKTWNTLYSKKHYQCLILIIRILELKLQALSRFSVFQSRLKSSCFSTG